VMIVKNIMSNEIANYEQLIENIPLASSTISQHIKILRDMNIITLMERKSKLFYRFSFNEENTLLGVLELVNLSDRKVNKNWKSEISLIERRPALEELKD